MLHIIGQIATISICPSVAVATMRSEDLKFLTSPKVPVPNVISL